MSDRSSEILTASSASIATANFPSASVRAFSNCDSLIQNHFSQERHLVDRQPYKTQRSAAVAEWQNLTA